MTDPKTQADKQLRRIEETTGRTVAAFAAEVTKAKLVKHGEIVAHLKAAHDLGHGDANLIAHLVRTELAGGPAPAGDLLDAQYAGKKAELRPIYEALAAVAEGLGPDVQKVVQKTGVSFRRNKQFALIQVPSAKRVQLGLNLDAAPADARVVETKGMCTHKVDLTSVKEVDAAVKKWLRAAYRAAR